MSLLNRCIGRWIAATLLCSAAVAAERPTPFMNQSRPRAAQVTMLAVSSSSRQSFAGNQEVYLADLQVNKGDHQFVRLIDQYPGYGLPIRDSLLRDQTLFTLRVTREPECDIPGREVFLAPTEAVVFNASARERLQGLGSEMIPCYKALHSTIRIAKVK